MCVSVWVFYIFSKFSCVCMNDTETRHKAAEGQGKGNNAKKKQQAIHFYSKDIHVAFPPIFLFLSLFCFFLFHELFAKCSIKSSSSFIFLFIVKHERREKSHTNLYKFIYFVWSLFVVFLGFFYVFASTISYYFAIPRIWYK